MKLREDVGQKLGLNPSNAVFNDRQVRCGARTLPLRQTAAEAEMVAEDASEFGEITKKYQQSTFGAHFIKAVYVPDHVGARPLRLQSGDL